MKSLEVTPKTNFFVLNTLGPKYQGGGRYTPGRRIKNE
jgi:hypothetical protein